jgi:hypothetical protein
MMRKGHVCGDLPTSQQPISESGDVAGGFFSEGAPKISKIKIYNTGGKYQTGGK